MFKILKPDATAVKAWFSSSTIERSWEKFKTQQSVFKIVSLCYKTVGLNSAHNYSFHIEADSFEALLRANIFFDIKISI